MKKLHIESELLWALFFVMIAVLTTTMMFGANSYHIDLSQVSLLPFLTICLTLALFLCHAAWTLSLKRATLFVIIACGFGFLTEYLGLHNGVIFGGTYWYRESGVTILNVPIVVMLFWASFTYTGYSFVNAGLMWSGRQKPSRIMRNWWAVLLLALCDSWVVVAIDLLMDPIQVKIGNWQWAGRGDYFGIPIGNFIGWFSVAFCICGLFRAIEYYFPQPFTRINRAVFLIPVLGYFGFAVAMIISALMYDMEPLAFIGGAAMLVPVVIMMVIFERSTEFHRMLHYLYKDAKREL